jgi:hypothetical protein
MERLLGIATLTTLALTASPARASADPAISLDWRAEADCPQGPQIVAEVERILGTPAGPRRHVDARADVTRTNDGKFRVTLVTSGADVAGRRSLEAESCREVASATALILALTVDPQRTLSEAPREELPPPPPSPAEKPAHVTPTRATKTFGASVSAAGDLGSFPSADLGVELALAWAPGRARVEAVGRRWASSTKTVSDAGADFDAWSAGLRGGAALVKNSVVSAGPIVGLEIDRIEAKGFGGNRAFEPNATFLAASAGALATWAPISRVQSFAFRLSIEGVAPFDRPAFVVREPAPQSATIVHRAAVVAGRATIGAEMFFF